MAKCAVPRAPTAASGPAKVCSAVSCATRLECYLYMAIPVDSLRKSEAEIYEDGGESGGADVEHMRNFFFTPGKA